MGRKNAKVEKVRLTSDNVTGYARQYTEFLARLAAEMTGITSGGTAISAGFARESMNYTFSDDFLTRLFYTVH